MRGLKYPSGARQAWRGQIVGAALAGVAAALPWGSVAQAQTNAAVVEVRHGDTFSAIATRVAGKGRPWQSLFNAQRTGLGNPNLIYPGMRFELVGEGPGSYLRLVNYRSAPFPAGSAEANASAAPAKPVAPVPAPRVAAPVSAAPAPAPSPAPGRPPVCRLNLASRLRCPQRCPRGSPGLGPPPQPWTWPPCAPRWMPARGRAVPAR